MKKNHNRSEQGIQPELNICNRHGLTIIEVLVALVIVGVLTAVLFPAVLSMRESARQTQCQKNLQLLGTALHAYHDIHQTLPPAAVWSTNETRSLALHLSKRIDLFTMQNWAQLSLPYANQVELAQKFDSSLPVAHPDNQDARTTPLSFMTCPSDTYNRSDNHHLFEATPDLAIDFARGNYAMNGGTHCFKTNDGSTAALSGDVAHLEIDGETRTFRMWGNGIAGINKSFSLDEFTNGTSTLVALEEIRAGIHPVDPRGAWAFGQIGSSVTWAHGINGDDYGPNNPWPRSDDLLGCPKLHDTVGTETLTRENMPCVSYLDMNQNATARSRHEGGVNVLLLDGSTRFISDQVDPGLWHVMHSRETPAEILADDFEKQIATLNYLDEAPKSERSPQILDGNSSQSSIKNTLEMDFVLIPAVKFTMGIPDSGNNYDLPSETPPHDVNISHSFYLGAHEVTQSEYQQVMENNPAFHQPGSTKLKETSRYPVERVTWLNAQEFCQRLSELPKEQAAGRRYRLPTEAEWEYACRAGSELPYQWNPSRLEGDKSGDAAGIIPPLPLSTIGSYPPNSFGLFDMRGNVWEWCSDWFDRDYYSRSPEIDPQGPAHGYLKVVRGSDWTFIGEGCKINYPMMPPWKSSPFVGFRVVCEITKSE